jgi:hypothetical protein
MKIFNQIDMKILSFIAFFLCVLLLPVDIAFADTDWSIINAPNAEQSYVNGMTAVSNNDVWAVGKSVANDFSSTNTLIEHYDGTAWKVILGVDSGIYATELNAIAHVSPTDIWAVGNSQDDVVSSQTLIEHWDGASWSVVDSPHGDGGIYSTLKGISVVSPTDIWAVGMSEDSGGVMQPLFLHYNGTDWRVVASPSLGSSIGMVNAVSSSSPTDVWAVGTITDTTTTRTLIEHWNGSSWSIVNSPNSLGSTNTRLWGVVALSASNAWAVGEDYASSKILIMNYDGATWKIIQTISTGTLKSIFSLSTNDIWAVGDNGAGQPFVMHYNGANWGTVQSPLINGVGGSLSTIAATATNDIWTGGFFYGGGVLFERNTKGITPPSLTDFLLNRDAYSFPNWSDKSAFDQLTQQLKAMVATNNISIDANLLAAILVPISDINNQPNGYCFGMVASAILYKQYPAIKPSVSKTTFALEKDIPDYARNKIAEYHQKQFPWYLDTMWSTLSATSAWSSSNPNNEYASLLTSLQTQHTPTMLLINGKDMKTGERIGHALIAYNIIDQGNTKIVQVYDSNDPFSSFNPEYAKRMAQFNSAKNSFSYTDGTDVYDQVWVRSPSLDYPDQTTQIVTNAFYGTLRWLRLKNMIQIHLHSPVTGLLTDGNGRRFGYVNGTFVNEISTAEMHHLDDDIVYYMPNTSLYTLTTTGTSEATPGATLGIDIALPTTGTEVRWFNYTEIPVKPSSTTIQAIGSSNVNNSIMLSLGGTKKPDTSFIMDDVKKTASSASLTTVLLPQADATLYAWLPHYNEGATNTLRVQAFGDSRALIKFDQAQIQQFIRKEQKFTATLQLTITDNGNNWGRKGVLFAIQRLTKNWIEGNGKKGTGATWHCAIDSNIANFSDDCKGTASWSMDNKKQYPFVSSLTNTFTIQNNQSGIVKFDVTNDIKAFLKGTQQNYGWVVKKMDEDHIGRIVFGSRESSHAPNLTITK